MATEPVRLGRPSGYNKSLIESICAEVASGGNLNQIVQRPEMPSHDTLYKWLDSYPAFAEAYARAIKIRAEHRFDKIDAIIEEVRSGKLDWQVGRLQIDTMKWQAGKENSRKFGDRITQEVTGANGGPVSSQVQIVFVDASSANKMIDITPEQPAIEQGESDDQA